MAKRKKEPPNKRGEPKLVQRELPVVNPEERKAMLELVEREVLIWARENGMKGEIIISVPTEEYFGWTITVQDAEGRHAQARMNKEGKPQMWEMTR
jgi:hypothetical protein